MIPVVGFVLLTLPCILSRELVATSSGGICTSPCDQEGKSYYWCWQKGKSGSTWGYCSPAERYDFQNNSCESACKFYGSSYRWCIIEGGNWGYCGHITKEFDIHYTRYGEPCVTDCDDVGGYFMCVDMYGNHEYCSPFNNVTIQGEPCRKNHICDLHGKSYTWCYTDKDNNWDYCANLHSDCETFFPLSNGKKHRGEEELCRIEDTEHRSVMILKAISESRLRNLTNNQFWHASRVINMITADTVFVRGTMFTLKTVRLDVQGDFLHDGVRYLNLQVQLIGQRKGQSSVSQALIPEDLEVFRYYRHIRRALKTSMQGAHHGDPVKVFIMIQRM